MTCLKSIRSVYYICFLLAVFLLLPAEAFSQQVQEDIVTEKINIEDFTQSLSKTLAIEKDRMDELQGQLDQLQKEREVLKDKLRVLTIQISAHNNLLMLPDTPIKNLEEARIINHSSRISIKESVNHFEQKAATMDILISQAEDQQLLNERHIKEFREQKPLSEPLKSVIEDLQELSRLLASKQTLMGKIQAIYQENIASLKETHDSLTQLAKKFEKEIQQRQRQEFFQRTSDKLFGLNLKTIYDEILLLINQVNSVFSKSFWETEISLVWRSSGLYIVSSFLLFVISISIFMRVGIHLDRFLKQPDMERYPWGCLTIRVFRRSLLLLCILLYCYIYSQILDINTGASFFNLALSFLFIWLLTKWPIDTMKLWNHDDRPELTFSVRFRIRLLIVFIRYFAFTYVAIEWLISSTSILLAIGRFGFEISLLIWTAFFWRLLWKQAAEFFSIEYKGITIFRSLTIGSLYTVVGVGFLMDLAGFGKLAVYWYTSCGKTLIVLLWAALVFKSLREMTRKAPSPIADQYPVKQQPSSPMRWLTLRFSWILLVFLTLFSTLLAWGAKQPLLVNILNIINYPFHVGQMRFSLLNLFYAVLIVVLTKVLVRFCQHLVRDKLLEQSGLEPGLKDSVVTITAYLIWAIGILIALHAFGLNATSLAVIFGALGIGLGFGLQNIFNNFISGIILLFERPIQVGDAIEINGVWGIVRKINVRSTLVQTYDNASLIIPNADFISTQVTNWSFKDIRLRRTISVGVAYGSDIALVKKTLEEIASSVHDVLKFPKPEVLFSDFGDSALVFRLRVWTNLDFMLSVESEIRFEINRLFNERNIEIAFPQRDLHIRTVDKEALLEIKGKENTITNEK